MVEKVELVIEGRNLRFFRKATITVLYKDAPVCSLNLPPRKGTIKMCEDFYFMEGEELTVSYWFGDLGVLFAKRIPVVVDRDAKLNIRYRGLIATIYGVRRR